MPDDWHLSYFSLRENYNKYKIPSLKFNDKQKTDIVSKHKRYRSLIATLLSLQFLNDRTKLLVKKLEDNKQPLSPLAVDKMDKQYMIDILNS